MAQSEWDERSDPERLLGHLARDASVRKLRLLACAIIRHAPFHPDGRTIWEVLPTLRWFRPGREGSRFDLSCHEVVTIAERQADGQATTEECDIARSLGFGAVYCAEADTFGFDLERHVGAGFRYMAADAVEVAVTPSPIWLARRLTRYWKSFRQQSDEFHADFATATCSLIRDALLGPERRKPIHPAWLTGPVREMAAAAYEGHRFDSLPVLADAMEEAGCTDQAVLRHCREPGMHARGCWVLDRVLGLG